ncbi:hypothetical protein, partial [Cecembia rubra]|uniref:hypothetical protein n=1 Tax=Cecembia rubra TaxID=1485585 RepID=UPI002714F507
STYAFWVGFPGWMNWKVTQFFSDQLLNLSEINSGPLSTLIFSGRPLVSFNSSRTSIPLS